MEIKIRQPLSFSEIGRKDNQEDNVYPSPKEVTVANRFFILCDGMGGHENGEVASDTVCRALGQYFETHIPADGIVTTDYFKEALEYAYDELDKQDNGAVKKMGTTMTCLYLHKKGYLVAHIGDSRIYHVRPENTDLTKGRLGIIYQSSDHSLVNDLLKAGELTEEEAINFPQKNIITRAMQPNLERRFKADVFSFTDIKAGDYFFLCSDGILEQLTNERLCEILSDTTTSDKQKLDAIRQVCYGNTKDNFTCYLIPIDKVIPENDDSHESGDDIIAGVVLECEEEEHCTIAPTMQNVPPQPTTKGHTPKKNFPWKWIALAILIIASLTYAITTWLGGDEKEVKPMAEQATETIEIEEEQTGTKESCIYEKTHSSKEENTASSDSSVVEDSAALMKLSM
ncbi:MAG: serine/threonine-protein phosphatase [Bacteroidales bacterium]|nr:serine/threonine-protein phosphatase [Bacteroidales bacterium]